ncbi:MAG: hypothetical protein AAB229_04590, partial [Candidatus Hydrogenedentota bacterium]
AGALGIMMCGSIGAHAAESDHDAMPQARRKLIMVEAETSDSGWVIASNIPASLKVKTGVASRDTAIRVIVTGELKARGIKATQPLVSALINRMLRYETLMDLQRRDIIIRGGDVAAGETRWLLNGDADPAELKAARFVIMEEKKDRSSVAEEIRKQFPELDSDTVAVKTGARTSRDQ